MEKKTHVEQKKNYEIRVTREAESDLKVLFWFGKKVRIKTVPYLAEAGVITESSTDMNTTLKEHILPVLCQ